MSNKILVCSNEEGLRESIKLVLGDNHDMIICDAVDQCDEIINNADIKILLLDIDKQTEVAESIQHFKSSNPNLKIVVLAHHKTSDLAQEAVTAGANGYIIKPFKSDELLSICK